MYFVFFIFDFYIINGLTPKSLRKAYDTSRQPSGLGSRACLCTFSESVMTFPQWLHLNSGTVQDANGDVVASNLASLKDHMSPFNNVVWLGRSAVK